LAQFIALARLSTDAGIALGRSSLVGLCRVAF